MKTLLLLRHAHAHGGGSHMADHDRPLSPAGESQALEIGRRLARENLRPELVLSSTAERARSTGDALLAAGLEQTPIESSVRLYGAGPIVFLEFLRGIPDQVRTVLLIAHNPGLEEFLHLLTGDRPVLAPGTLARVAVTVDRWGDLMDGAVGRLTGLWPPTGPDSE
jgi:phosphohistidine phosphatase